MDDVSGVLWIVCNIIMFTEEMDFERRIEIEYALARNDIHHGTWDDLKVLYKN